MDLTLKLKLRKITMQQNQSMILLHCTIYNAQLKTQLDNPPVNINPTSDRVIKDREPESIAGHSTSTQTSSTEEVFTPPHTILKGFKGINQSYIMPLHGKKGGRSYFGPFGQYQHTLLYIYSSLHSE